MMEIRNPKHNGFGGIDCEVNHPKYGWIPFTANSYDPDESGQEVYRAVLEMPIAAADPVDEAAILEAARSYMECSRFQAKAALLSIGKLETVEAIIGQADVHTKLAWAEASTFKRNSPLLNQLSKHPLVNMSDEDLDNLFRVAMQVVV